MLEFFNDGLVPGKIDLNCNFLDIFYFNFLIKIFNEIILFL
jgi:hypothetical protein